MSHDIPKASPNGSLREPIYIIFLCHMAIVVYWIALSEDLARRGVL